MNTSESQEAWPKPGVAWSTVLILLLLSVFSQIDRRVITILVDPIKTDLQLTDVQMGLILGPAFGLVYAFAGLPCGWLVDRFNRRPVVAGGAFLWGLATLWTGFATSFATQLMARMGIGATEAAITPAAHSMIGDLFPRDRMAFPLSVFGLAVALGSGIGLSVGGVLYDLASRPGGLGVPLLSELRAWQVVFVLVAIPSMLLAGLAFVVPEPARRRHAPKTGEDGSLAHLWAFLKSRPRILLAVYLGVALTIMATGSMTAWVPTYCRRMFGWSSTELGLTLGTLDLVSGVLGYLFAGKAIDHLFRKGIRDAHLKWLMWAHLLGAPIIIVGLLSASPTIFVIATALYHFIIYPCLGYGAAVVQIMAPPALRGRLSALLFLCIYVLGNNIGPPLTAVFTEHVFRDPLKLGFALACVVAIISPAAALLAWQGQKPMREAPETARP